VLSSAADFLNRAVHHVFPIATVVGLMSSIIDNVPLVAACMGMYPIADAAAVASAPPGAAQRKTSESCALTLPKVSPPEGGLPRSHLLSAPRR